MNKARAALDALMGPNRDAKDKNKEKFKDPSVCKSFLLDLCPMAPGYLGGKRTFIACTKIHSEIMKGQFKVHPEFEKLKLQYQLDAWPDFEYALSECGTRIVEEKKRIKEDWGNRRPPLPPDAVQEIHFMRRAHRVRLEEAESLDDDHYQDRIKLMREAEELAKDANAYEELELQKAKDAAIPEECCEICGTSYKGSAGNAAHEQFRIHTAYLEIRERHAQMKETVAKAKAELKEDPEPRSGNNGEENAGDRSGRGGTKDQRDGRSQERMTERDGRDGGRKGRDAEPRGRGQDSRSRGRGGTGRELRGRAHNSRSRGRGGRDSYKPRGRACDSRSRSRGGGGRQPRGRDSRGYEPRARTRDSRSRGGGNSRRA